MKVALYARVSTRDKDQNPETQLLALRRHAETQEWEIYREYVDEASALDLRGRPSWRELLKDAARHRFKILVVVRIDRAFRSPKDMHDTLAELELSGVDFIATAQDWDTTTAAGRLMQRLLVDVAAFEAELTRERIHDGLERARAEGKSLGRRPSLSGDQRRAIAAAVPRILQGDMSQAAAAKWLGVSRRTIRRAIQAEVTE